MKKWWIGCSGFYYKHWRSGFYPKDLPVKRWFEYYCEFFNTVELNVTFYRFPKLEALEGWYDRSPKDFRFTVKAPRLITHYKKFKEAKRETDEFYDVVTRGLREKLGTILFQLHPRFIFTEENMERLLTTLHPAYANVVEFRHASWWNDQVIKLLKEHNITFCSISYPSLPDKVIRTSPVVYYRFHGVPQLYLSPYSSQEMADVADSIRKLRKVDDVYIYFNNDIEVSAIHNAREFQRLASSSQSVVPH
jgi:uncharacterized protein YecE (DUF72 family)